MNSKPPSRFKHKNPTQRLNHMVQVGDVILSPDILTEEFCCDLDACKGQCCIEGDSGAPLNLDEVSELEKVLPIVSPDLSSQARTVIEKQGVAYTDEEGDLVTSIVNNKDCVFTSYNKGCCLCSIDKAYRRGNTHIQKPISCFLYPIREKILSNGLSALNYHRWNICQSAREKGRLLHLPLYLFLKEPLCRRFGKEWYELLQQTVSELKKQGLI